MTERAALLNEIDLNSNDDLLGSSIIEEGSLEDYEGIYLLPYNIAKRKVIESFTNEYLKKRLEHNKGNVTRAAEESGLLREAFHQIMKRYSIKSTDFRER